MRVISHNIDYQSRADVIRIVPLGDIHLGHALCDEGLLTEWVQQIADDPLCYWGGMGDICEFINRSDWRAEESQRAKWLWGESDLVKAQVEKVRRIFEPITDKCLWLVRGNHEDSILKKYERDAHYEVCRALGVSEQRPLDLGYRGFVRLRCRRMKAGSGEQSTWTLVLYVHHGYGGGRLEGAKALKLGRLPKVYQADVYLYGHSHARMAQVQQVLRPARRADRLEAVNVWEAMTGSFLQSYDANGQLEVYSEALDFPPQMVGPIEILVQPDKHEIRVRM